MATELSIQHLPTIKNPFQTSLLRDMGNQGRGLARGSERKQQPSLVLYYPLILWNRATRQLECELVAFCISLNGSHCRLFQYFAPYETNSSSPS